MFDDSARLEGKLKPAKQDDQNTKDIQNAQKPHVRGWYNEKQWKFKKEQAQTIDYVLVWDGNCPKATSVQAALERLTFESNLEAFGLKLEQDFTEETRLHFVKIHAPLNVLKSYTEILKLRMPIKDELNKVVNGLKPDKHEKACLDVSQDVFPTCNELTAAYVHAKDYLFDTNSIDAFTPAHKARVIQFILERTFYAENEESDVFKFGIDRLILSQVYTAAFPLHDGERETPGTKRYDFYNDWAAFRNWYKYQPVDHLKQYFGVRTALYFLWLGYYIRMLFLAALYGLCCFIFSVIYRLKDEKIEGVLCPLCDGNCSFTNLADAISRLRNDLQYIFDNDNTVSFAIFISFWSAAFLQGWKRYLSEITVRWDLTSIDDQEENPRPEYAAKLSKLAANNQVKHKINFITNATEPLISFWRYVFLGKVISFTSMLLLISMALAALIGVCLYYMFAIAIMPEEDEVLFSLTASILNLISILIFSPIYIRLTKILTNLEMPRTQREYDDSLTVKLFLLEFINHYSSIFYIAFFKGKFSGPPSGYYKIFGARQIECGMGGCMLELTQQLAVIMIGKRAFRFLQQAFIPHFKLKYQRYKKNKMYAPDKEVGQWERDFDLSPIPALPLFLTEYMDMVIQYGFVAIFSAAFPLAPLFAFINNIFEMRIDARKYLLYHRRPTMRRTRDIGVWFNILNTISYMAVFTNGYIIAFTSQFIPTVVYRLTEKKLGLQGFWNYSLSYIAISDLDIPDKPNTTFKYCRYPGFRQPPWSDHKYELTHTFWLILVLRLLFFIFFENVIYSLVALFKLIIPDVPFHVKQQMRRRHYLINEMIIAYETIVQTSPPERPSTLVEVFKNRANEQMRINNKG